MIRNFLAFAVLTTFVVVSWIIFTITHSVTTTTISKDVSIIISPIPNSFDKETINMLKTKSTVQADINEKRIQITPTILPSTTPNPILNPLLFEEQKELSTSSSQLNL